MSSGYKRFLCLWAGELVSSIGGGLTSFGLTVYVFSQTGSAASTSLVALLAFLPNLLLGMPAGVLADRMDRRKLMMLGDGLSALGLIYILVCMFTGGAALWQICLGVAVSSVFSALMDPAYKATVTDLLSEEEYTKSAGLVSLAGSARYLLSPVLAGLLLTVTDIRCLLVIDICTFFLTVAVTAAVSGSIAVSARKDKPAFIEDMKVGWRVVSGNRGVLTLLVMASLMTFCMGSIQILSQTMILDFADSATLGYGETICACGMLVTSVLIGIFGLKKHIHKALCLSLCGAGLFMALFGLWENLPMILSSGFAFFAMIPIANTSLDYLVRTNIDNEYQGRAWGLVGFISQIGYVFSYSLCGLAADGIAAMGHMSVGRGSGMVIVISGLALVLLTVPLYLAKSVRKLEKQRP